MSRQSKRTEPDADGHSRKKYQPFWQSTFSSPSRPSTPISPAYTILADLREGVAQRLVNASLGTAQSASIGRLKNTVVDRIEQIEVPLAHMIPEFSANLVLAVAIAIWIVAIDARLALACIVTIPIGVVILAIGSGGYLFVSHSTEQVQRVCNKALWIDKSKTMMIGEVNEICAAYERHARGEG